MLTKISVKKPFTVFVAVVIVLVFGLVGLYKMTPDLFPNISAPYSIVMTTYPGASAEEVELEITDPMEQQLATLSKLDNITSVSADNYSVVTLQFTDDVNMDSMTVDIRDKIDQIEGYLPESAAAPLVMKMNMDMMPVTVAAVAITGKDTAEVSTFVKEELETDLEGIEGVASISKVGMVDEGIQIVLSQDKINSLNREISNAINSKFASGEGELKKGISRANSGSKEIDKGKKGIKQGETEASKQFDSAINQTKASRQELENQLRALENDDTPDEDQEEEIQKIKATIGALDEALTDLQSQKEKVSFNLSTNYSDIAASQSSLSSVVSQLQSTLSEVESQKEAALDSADLTGIITMENVSSILAAQNFSMPAGYVTDGEADILVSVGNKIEDADELKNLILFDMGIDGVEPIRVKDIGTVSYMADDSATYAKIDGENGILLSFTKQSTYATATVADNISEKFRKLEEEHENLKFTALMDQGEYIHVVINSVFRDLLLGALFAILVLLFFLRDIRPTMITAISIPVSVVFAVAMMYFTGVTLNMISISGLAIGVGMLVDNSIVVIENIYRLRSMGYSAVQAAVSGAGQVAGAITASTLTTICVFVPVVFVNGMTRELFQDLALTVTYSLAASLLIALTFVPAVAKGALVRKTGKTVLGRRGRVVAAYRRAVAWALIHKKRLLVAALVLLLASTSLLLTRGFEFMPSMSSSQISATVSMPEDSTLKDTARVNDKICEELLEIDGVESVGAMLSSSMADMFGGSVSSSDKDVTETSIYVILEENLLEQSDAVADKLQQLGKKYNCEVVTSSDVDMTQYTGGSGISIALYGEDLDKLRTTASAIEKRMKDVKGLEEISDVGENSTQEIRIVVNKNAAMKKGLTVAQVYQAVSEKLQKDKKATSLTQNGSTIDVSIENAEKNRFTRQNLMDMKISVKKNDGKTDKIPLTSIADVHNDSSLSVINHNNQKRCQTVKAGVADGYNITKKNSEIRRIIEKEGLVDSGVTAVYGGENENIMNSMKQMVLMMLVGIILVYLIMVAQFQSLRSPFIIIFTLPLAFTGGMLALLITNQVLSVVAMMGFVMLVGIVVNNGIVLVDCINRFRLEGMGTDEAIIEAGAVRMRPVLMTASTTVLGLIPLALGFGEGAEMVQPVAIVCIGGLVYATVTTLFIIPIMYRWLSRKHMEKIKEEELEIVNV